MKAKQDKGVDQLMDEGSCSVVYFRNEQQKIIGTVGALQYE
jgi:peptide subunit release factor RF-3